MEMSDSEDERGLKSLFKCRSESDEVFYFSDIVILPREIVFKFRFCDDAFFESRVVLSENADLDSGYMRTCFSIGMCVCAWYWMGYYTDRIVIEETVCTKCHICPDMMPFWDELYKQIALEFAFVNKTPLKLVHFKLEGYESATSWTTAGAHRARTKAYGALIPMGGGKDSLVVWHQYQQQAQATAAAPPLLLYVADGMDEYNSSARLQKLIAMTGNDLRLVRHDFQTQLLHRRKRSFLKPCAHPWAALVFFDALLVAQLEGIGEVRLGYERSADEGNGVFVQGLEVNHQFDKSSAFLHTAQQYAQLYLTPSSLDGICNDTAEMAEVAGKGVQVVSTLHGLWEIQIARIFCEAPELHPYLPVFLSCNDPTERGDWCKRCEKCAFIFLLLSAWLPPREVVESVFGGENMLLQEGVQRVLFRRLLGLEEGGKPLDCVGTVAEASAAVHLATVRYASQEDAGQGESLVPAVLTDLCAELAIDCCCDASAPCKSPVVRTADDILMRWAVDK